MFLHYLSYPVHLLLRLVHFLLRPFVFQKLDSAVVSVSSYGVYPVRPHLQYSFLILFSMHSKNNDPFRSTFGFLRSWKQRLFNISIFLKPFLLHFTHISVLKYSCQSRSLQNSTIVKSRNKVLGLTEANLRFGGTSQEWNLSNLFVSIPFLIDWFS